MTITIRVGNAYSQIENLKDIEVIDKISAPLSYVLNSARYSYQYKMGNWDGRNKLLTKKLKFPTGCLDIVVGVLNTLGREHQVVDEREWVEPPPVPAFRWKGYDLFDYQKEIVDSCISKKSGMVKAATGAGKSIILSRLAYEYNTTTMIYVVSLDLLEQMHETLSKSLGIPIGYIGGGKCTIEKINVCSAWTVGKIFAEGKKEKAEEGTSMDKWSPSQRQKNEIKEAVENAKLVILDEAHFAAGTTIQNILKNSKSAANRYGFSATPWRAGGDDLLLTAGFGDEVCDLKASRLIKEGYLVQPKIIFRDIPPLKIQGKKNWATVKSEYIVNNDTRNEILIDNIKRLLDKDRRPLLLFEEIKHGKMLESMLPNGVKYSYVTGSSSDEERTQLRKDFEAGDIDLILASKIFNTGVNIPSIDALVVSTGGKSSALALQKVGRAIRTHPGKKDAYIVETYDQASFVKDHSIARYRAYIGEPEYKVKCGENMSKYIKKYNIR